MFSKIAAKLHGESNALYQILAEAKTQGVPSGISFPAILTNMGSFFLRIFWKKSLSADRVNPGFIVRTHSVSGRRVKLFPTIIGAQATTSAPIVF